MTTKTGAAAAVGEGVAERVRGYLRTYAAATQGATISREPAEVMLVLVQHVFWRLTLLNSSIVAVILIVAALAGATDEDTNVQSTVIYFALSTLALLGAWFFCRQSLVRAARALAHNSDEWALPRTLAGEPDEVVPEDFAPLFWEDMERARVHYRAALILDLPTFDLDALAKWVVAPMNATLDWEVDVDLDDDDDDDDGDTIRDDSHQVKLEGYSASASASAAAKNAGKKTTDARAIEMIERLLRQHPRSRRQWWRQAILR